MSLVTVFATINSTIYMSKIPLSVLTPQLEEVNIEIPQMGGTMNILAGIGAGVSLLTGWVITTLITHTMGRLIGEKGSLRRLFAINGFAATPNLVNQILRTIDAQITDSATLIRYFITYRETRSKILRAIIGSNLLNIWTLATIALLTIGLEENYNLQRGKALIIALTPTALLLVLTYYTG